MDFYRGGVAEAVSWGGIRARSVSRRTVGREPSPIHAPRSYTATLWEGMQDNGGDWTVARRMFHVKHFEKQEISHKNFHMRRLARKIPGGITAQTSHVKVLVAHF